VNLEPLEAAQLGDLLPFVTEYHAFEGIDMAKEACDNAAARAVYSRLGFEARDRFSMMSVELEGKGSTETG